MSKHESALALIDEQIEKEEKSRQEASSKRALAQGALERAEKELALINWSLEQLQASRSSLLFDRSAVPVNHPDEEELPTVTPANTKSPW